MSPAGSNFSLRLLAWLLLAVVLCLVQVAQAGETYRFGGPPVKNCPRDGKEYKCTAFPLTNWDDRMVIETGYTVIFTTDISFGYNHALSMSGTASLITSGNLNIGDIAPAGTQIAGGSFTAGGKFTVGNQNQTITANITAGSMQLGSGSRLEITGTIASAGPIDISSNVIINGPVTGTDIVTGSTVTINGDIEAKNGRLVLQHGNKVKGKVTARVAELLASSVVVTGPINATQSLTLASGNTVEGNIETGVLTLQDSEAIVKGTALVDRADLFYHGRVTGFIQCRSGATVNDCSCVNNQSGYPFNSELGPKCGPTKPPAANGLHHFLIEHDASAGTCTAAKVKVTACADAACNNKYTGGATVTLQPGGASTTIGNTGVTTAEVSSIVAGKTTLTLTSSGATPSSALVCRANGSGVGGCSMEFTGGVNFNVTVADHKAGENIIALIKAVKANDNNTACVPGFVGAKDVTLSCGRVLPLTGKFGLTLDPTPGATPEDAKALACNGTATYTFGTSFDANGTTRVGLSYPDAGQLTLNAAAAETRGKGGFVVSPDHFALSAPKPLRAGLNFDLTVEARNKNKELTPNFDTTLLGKDATPVEIVLDCVVGKLEGALKPGALDFKEGRARPATSFSEVGLIDVKASLTKFLGKTVDVSGSSNATANGCSGNIGPFIPMYYQVELNDPARIQVRKDKTFSYFYSNEPIRLKISAMNAQGQPTVNYPVGYGGGDTFTLSALDEKGVALLPTLGQLSGALNIAHFTKGVTSIDAARTPTVRYSYAAAQTTPTNLRLRVEAKDKPTGYEVTSADTAACDASLQEKACPVIRNGRLRIGSRFGPARSNLDLPLTAEYWSGKSWVRNDDDNFTVIPASAVALTAGFAQQAKPVQLANGAGTLRLRRDDVGAIDVAANLGKTTTDSSCLASKTTSVAGDMPWLQSRSGCIDPSARATFGVQSTENRRIIHVREAYR